MKTFKKALFIILSALILVSFITSSVSAVSLTVDTANGHEIKLETEYTHFTTVTVDGNGSGLYSEEDYEDIIVYPSSEDIMNIDYFNIIISKPKSNSNSQETSNSLFEVSNVDELAVDVTTKDGNYEFSYRYTNDIWDVISKNAISGNNFNISTSADAISVIKDSLIFDNNVFMHNGLSECYSENLYKYQLAVPDYKSAGAYLQTANAMSAYYEDGKLYIDYAFETSITGRFGGYVSYYLDVESLKGKGTITFVENTFNVNRDEVVIGTCNFDVRLRQRETTSDWRLVMIIEETNYLYMDIFDDKITVSYRESLGDVNDNGEIDKMDYLAIKRYCNNVGSLDNESIHRADVNMDGVVDKNDYLMLKRLCFGTATLYR